MTSTNPEACRISVASPVHSIHGAGLCTICITSSHQVHTLARPRKSALGHLVGKSFGTLLQEYREKAQLSVQQLAVKSAIDRKYIYQLEKGLSQPTLETIFRLVNALGIDCTEMLARSVSLVARGSALRLQTSPSPKTLATTRRSRARGLCSDS
jgi:transcriptional regulator with XRE-family HTH domain